MGEPEAANRVGSEKAPITIKDEKKKLRMSPYGESLKVGHGFARNGRNGMRIPPM